MLIPALAGMVIIQERRMYLIVERLIAERPLARPIPRTDPTRQCVVEMGRPSLEAIRMVVAAPNSAQKPRVGVSAVIFLPMVSITRQPHVAKPITIPRPPRASNQGGTWEDVERAPVLMTSKTAATGPMALETSLAPCEKAT